MRAVGREGAEEERPFKSQRHLHPCISCSLTYKVQTHFHVFENWKKTFVMSCSFTHWVLARLDVVDGKTFLLSCSITNQVLAQLAGLKNRVTETYTGPLLAERLHLLALSAELTVCTRRSQVLQGRSM